MKEGRGNTLQINTTSRAQVDFSNHFRKYFGRVVPETYLATSAALPEPRLLDANDNHVLATGYASIEKQLNADVDLLNGARAAFLLTAFSILLARAVQLFPFVHFVAVLGCILAYSKGLGCLSCSVGGDNLVGYAALSIFLFSAGLMEWFNYKKKNYPSILPALYFSFCLAQAILLLLRPQFCVYCIGMGACLEFMTYACAEFNALGKMTIVSAGKLVGSIKAVMSIIIVGLAVKQATGSGRYSDVETLKIDPKIYSQFDIRSIFPKMETSNQVLIVTNQGCEACEVALSHFKAWNLQYYNVRVAEMPTELRGVAIMTPTIMKLDNHNRISKIIVGWPSEQIMEERLHELLAAR